jgi:hypothetical protein
MGGCAPGSAEAFRVPATPLAHGRPARRVSSREA